MPPRPKQFRPAFQRTRAAVNFAADAARGTSTQRGYDAAWRRLRKAHLIANPLCVFHLAVGETVAATVGDHIVSIRDAPERRLDPSNLQSLCKSCHDRLRQREQAAERMGQGVGAALFGQGLGAPETSKRRPAWFRKTFVPVTVVCGPPAAGKSTYVARQAGPRDLVIDFDRIAVELFGAPPAARVVGLTADQVGDVLRARNDRLADLMWRKALGRWPHAWLIVAEPDAKARAWWADTLGAEVVVVEATPEQCLARAREAAQRGDERGDDIESRIIRWFAAYQPRESDTIVQ
jgi:5-methylcytosine-specific restriction protein A